MHAGTNLTACENKQATTLLDRAPVPATGQREREPCRFILGDGNGHSRRPRVCAAPSVPGSAYCARHRALCSISPDSAAGERVARGFERAAGNQAWVPNDLAFLSSVAVPEFQNEDEREDIAACLDWLPDRDRNRDDE